MNIRVYWIVIFFLPFIFLESNEVKNKELSLISVIQEDKDLQKEQSSSVSAMEQEDNNSQSKNPPPISVVEAQLADAQAEFDQAKKEFNPWYSGPLLTGSAHVMPLGYANIQPYVFATVNHGRFDKGRHSRDINTLLFINPLSIIQFGVVKDVDMAITFAGVWQQQNDVSSGGFADLPVQLGIGLAQEGPYVPAVKIYLSESFPTGKYEKGKAQNEGLDLVGNGSFITSLSLNMSKVVWWMFGHPQQFRFTTKYDLYPSKINVKGLNSYGGTPDTNGQVTRGRGISANLGYEASITRRWVYATDIAYTYNNKSTFKGNPGTRPDGSKAKIGDPSSDSISIAPAIEYNQGPNFGIVAGVWFSVYGRNTSDFISGIFTFQWTF